MDTSFTVHAGPVVNDFYLQWREIWEWHLKFQVKLMFDEANKRMGSN